MAEAEEKDSLDAAPPEEDGAYILGMTDLEEREQEMMDRLQYEGMPKSETERRRVWLSFPREARAAVRRLHAVMDHAPRSVLIHILKGAKADKETTGACKHFRCPSCAEIEKEGTPQSVNPLPNIQ